MAEKTKTTTAAAAPTQSPDTAKPAGPPAIGTPLTASTQHVRIGRQTTQPTVGGPVRQRKVDGIDEPLPAK